jgi:DNA-binding transcriptional regulator YdaS (Cro superfamily)
MPRIDTKAGTMPSATEKMVREPKAVAPNRNIGILGAMEKTALQLACRTVGGQKALADRLGVRQSTVWYWLARSKRGVPAEYVMPIEAATGISRHLLRPDIFPAVKGRAAA